VRLPSIATPAAAPAPATAPELEPGASATRRILVADDNRDSADTFASLFRMAGNEVATAYDGVEALTVAEQFRPDVALLDIGMPKVDGYEVCKRIRAEKWGRSMVLIAHTGWSEIDRVDAAGFDGRLTKPADYAALTQLLDKLPARSEA
jgi:CheY-like chemotaxis protein